LLARGSDGGSGGDARGGGRGKGRGAKTTGPEFKPAKGTPGRKVFIADNMMMIAFIITLGEIM